MCRAEFGRDFAARGRRGVANLNGETLRFSSHRARQPLKSLVKPPGVRFARRGPSMLRRIHAALLLALLVSTAARAEKRGVVFVAMPGAGKTTAADYLAAKHGLTKWTSGDVVRKTIAERGLPYNAANDKAVAEEFARKPGEIGRRVAADVAAAPGSRAIIEGFRTVAELAAFKAALPGFKVVAIEVGAARRYARMLKRGRPGEDNLAYLRDRDRREIKRGVRQVMRMADLRIRPRGDDMKGLERSLVRVEKYLK
jgi:dephospho-CoA kinase